MNTKATTIDHMNFHNAGALADTIEEFWRSQGHAHVIAWRYEMPGFPGVYGIRSNLIAGLPPASGK